MADIVARFVFPKQFVTALSTLVVIFFNNLVLCFLAGIPFCFVFCSASRPVLYFGSASRPFLFFPRAPSRFMFFSPRPVPFLVFYPASRPISCFLPRTPSRFSSFFFFAGRDRAVQYAGFTCMPFVGGLLSFLLGSDSISLIGDALVINQFTAPAFVMCIAASILFALLYLSLIHI